MIFSGKSQIFAIVITIAISVLLFFAPKKSVEPLVSEVSMPASEIMQAVEMVRSGQDPMAGIMKLRKVLEENPQNAEAHFYLGVFSVQSGQYDKAIERLNTVLSLDKNYIDAYLYLGQAFASKGEKENAIKNYEKFKASVNDEKLKAEAEKHINELKNS